MDANKVFQKFLDGEFDYAGYFGDIQTFFDAMKDKGVLKNLDLQKIESDDWQNEYLIWLYENDKDKFDWWMRVFLSDVEEIDGKLQWVGNREDLSVLFCDSREISQKSIEEILSGEGDWYDRYWDTTDDVYRDVIGELNSKNFERLKEYIIENLKGRQLSPESEEMELIAAEQGHGDYWEINSDVVSRILDDEDSMNSLLNDELSDLKSELYSIHSNAYNSAYESTIYDEVWSEINEYFKGKGRFEYRPHPWKKETQIEKFIIEPEDFYGVVLDYLEDYKKSGSRGLLENEGSFLSILKENRDCLSLRVPDYPSFHQVDENINIYFNDYL